MASTDSEMPSKSGSAINYVAVVAAIVSAMFAAFTYFKTPADVLDFEGHDIEAKFDANRDALVVAIPSEISGSPKVIYLEVSASELSEEDGIFKIVKVDAAVKSSIVLEGERILILENLTGKICQKLGGSSGCKDYRINTISIKTIFPRGPKSAYIEDLSGLDFSS